MKKKVLAVLLAATMAFGLAACGSSSSSSSSEAEETTEEETAEEEEAVETETEETEEAEAEEETAEVFEETEIQVFIAASLNTVMQEIASMYNEIQPNVTIRLNADSSGTLLTQIEEGYECDIFFSAAQKQMNTLEEDGLIVEGTRADVLNNQVVVITYAGSETSVTGLDNIGDAESIALADGSVPVGKYTREALISMGVLDGSKEASEYTTEEVSEALGGVEISEQSNVSKVLEAVKEASCEVGTTYYSDTYGYEDLVEILEVVSYDLTGDVIYPICQVQNDEADELQTAAAADFLAYILSDEVKDVLDSYYFDTDL